jgi:hypothetical protein
MVSSSHGSAFNHDGFFRLSFTIEINYCKSGEQHKGVNDILKPKAHGHFKEGAKIIEFN